MFHKKYITLLITSTVSTVQPSTLSTIYTPKLFRPSISCQTTKQHKQRRELSIEYELPEQPSRNRKRKKRSIHYCPTNHNI